MTLLSIAPLGVLILFSNEWSQLRTVYFLSHYGLWLQLSITAMTGFSVNIAMIYLIKYTSSLTHGIAVVSKSLVIAILFNNLLSTMNLVGILISLAAFVYYIPILKQNGEVFIRK
ncbi:hypothetical protein BDF14DRAFT_1740086 [Spinellus fusiger]|nr:hypothetical protein BDF14DRAFT_1740086 [Spinellus fusiger]